MNVTLRKPFTLSEFLDWEERQTLRHEFDGVRPFAMAGGSYEHDAIQVNLVTALNNGLRGTPCRVHGNSLKIRVMDSIRYPDAFVSCGPVQRGSQIVTEPVAVFEVVSASTSRTDRIVKLREYQATDSILFYAIIEQDSVAATVFTREGQVWAARALTGGDALAIPQIGIDLALADLYEGIDLPPVDDGADDPPPG